jgi:hypothetical protein
LKPVQLAHKQIAEKEVLWRADDRRRRSNARLEREYAARQSPEQDRHAAIVGRQETEEAAHKVMESRHRLDNC